MAQFVEQDAQQHGHDPRQEKKRIDATAAHAKDDRRQPEKRMNAHGETQQRKMDISLGRRRLGQKHV